jgi:transposase-like protein
MEFKMNSGGRRIYPSEFKKQILDEVRQGETAASLGRKYGIPIHNILYWKQAEERALTGQSKSSKAEEQIPISEYKRLLEENKNLKYGRGPGYLERGRRYRVKKKWLSLVK